MHVENACGNPYIERISAFCSCGFCWISDKTVTVNIRLVTALIRRKSSQSVASNKNKNAKACAEIEAQIYIDGSISACGLAV